MADLRGRCKNLLWCSAGVSQRIIVLPEGSKFVCPKCGEPLQPVQPRQAQRIGLPSLALWTTLAAATGGSAVYLVLSGAATNAGAYVSTAWQNWHRPTIQSSLPPILPARVPVPPAAPPPSPAPSTTTLLRLAGVDVVDVQLARRLAAGYLALIGDAPITASTAANGTLEIVGVQVGQREAIAVTPGSSSDGVTALLRGAADFAMSSGRISAADVERLASLSDMTGPASEHPIADTLPPTRRVYLYNAPLPDNAFVSRFLGYVGSPAGQAVISAAGYVPVQAAGGKPAVRRK